MNVPVLSMIFMVASVLLMMVIPIMFMMYVNMRFKTGFSEVAKGAIAYFFMVLIIGGFLTQTLFSAGGEELANARIPRMLVAVVVPVTVEVFGLSMVLGRRTGDKLSFGRFLQYGCGFGLAELLLVASGSLINNIIYSFTYRMQGMEGLMAVAGEASEAELAAFIETMAQESPFTYLLPGIEGVLLAAFRVGAVLMIYMMLTGRMTTVWMGLLYVMYVAIMLPPVLVDMEILPEVVLHVLLVLLCAGFVVYFVLTAKKRCHGDWLILTGKEKLKKKEVMIG